MNKNNDKNQRHIHALINSIKVDQPTQKVSEYIGLTRYELEQKHPSHYILHSADTGNLELTVDAGLISCLIKNGVCTEAYFLSDDDDDM